jgi:hypothetical protein
MHILVEKPYGKRSHINQDINRIISKWSKICVLHPVACCFGHVPSMGVSSL